MQTNKLTCPNCGTEIDVNHVLYSKIEEDLKLKYQDEATKNERVYISKLKELSEKEEQFKSKSQDIDIQIKSQVENQLKIESIKIESDLKKKIEDENSLLIESKNKEIQEKAEKLKDFTKTQIEFEKLKIEKDQLKEELELEHQKKLNEILQEERTKIKRTAEEEHRLQLLDHEKMVNDLKKQLDDMKSKTELGSQQRQGEVQELEIENILTNQFPFDIIDEIKKGQRGGDCIQSVRTNYGVDCGKIYYESKRTKDFANPWINKLKEDNLEVKADILVIVTQAMPDEEKKYLFRDGVWICQFNEIRWFSRVLRQGLIDMQSIAVTQHNKDAKMEMLYNYLTSREFKGQLETIIDGFGSLRNAHEDEKKKQFDRILDNAIGFYGSLRGIAGNSIPVIQSLEDNIVLLEN